MIHAAIAEYQRTVTPHGIIRSAFNIFIPWPERFTKKIHSIKQYSNPPGSNNLYKRCDEYFDQAGRIIEIKRFKEGNTEDWKKFTYHDNGLFETEYVFSGRKIRHLRSNERNPPKKYPEVEEYNAQGQRIVSSLYIRKKTVKTRTIYNSTGQILDIKNFQSDGTQQSHYSYTYNPKFQLIRASHILQKEEIIFFRYDSDGFLIEEITHAIVDDIEKAFADVPDASNGFSSKYFYNSEKLLDTHNLYLCGRLIMVYKYQYSFW